MSRLVRNSRIYTATSQATRKQCIVIHRRTNRQVAALIDSRCCYIVYDTEGWGFFAANSTISVNLLSHIFRAAEALHSCSRMPAPHSVDSDRIRRRQPKIRRSRKITCRRPFLNCKSRASSTNPRRNETLSSRFLYPEQPLKQPDRPGLREPMACSGLYPAACLDKHRC